MTFFDKVNHFILTANGQFLINQNPQNPLVLTHYICKKIRVKMLSRVTF